MAKEEGTDFVSTIVGAQRVQPEMPSSPFGVSLPPGVRAARGADKVPGGVETDLVFGVRRFAIPGDEVEYKAIRDRALRGEIMLGLREATFDKEGTYLIVQEWLEPQQGALARVQAGGAPHQEEVAAPRRAP